MGQLFPRTQFTFKGWNMRNLIFLSDLGKHKTNVANHPLASFCPRTNTPRARVLFGGVIALFDRSNITPLEETPLDLPRIGGKC